MAEKEACTTIIDDTIYLIHYYIHIDTNINIHTNYLMYVESFKYLSKILFNGRIYYINIKLLKSACLKKIINELKQYTEQL